MLLGTLDVPDGEELYKASVGDGMRKYHEARCMNELLHIQIQ